MVSPATDMVDNEQEDTIGEWARVLGPWDSADEEETGHGQLKDGDGKHRRPSSSSLSYILNVVRLDT